MVLFHSATWLTDLQCGFEAGARLSPLVTLIAKLNNTVPQFQLRFPNEKRVQKPLQEVYTEFIEAHLFLIEEFTKGDPGELILPYRSEMVAFIDPMQHLMWTLQKKRRCKHVSLTQPGESRRQEVDTMSW